MQLIVNGKEDIKPETEEISKNKIDVFELFSKYKSIIYSVLFYLSGLILGSVIYTKFQSDTLNKLILSGTSDELLTQFVNDLSRYSLAFAASVLLGLCVLGFPVINFVPLLLGLLSASNISYYYCAYGIKGFGYSMLLIAPFSALLLTLIILTISKSFELSKRIYDITVKKDNQAVEINYKEYLKSILIYGIFIVLAAFLEALASTAIGGIIAL